MVYHPSSIEDRVGETGQNLEFGLTELGDVEGTGILFEAG